MQLHAQPLRPAPWPRNLQHQPSSYTFPEPLWASLVPEPGHGGEQLDGATLLQEGQVHALGNSARAGGGAQDRAEMPVPGRGGMGHRRCGRRGTPGRRHCTGRGLAWVQDGDEGKRAPGFLGYGQNWGKEAQSLAETYRLPAVLTVTPLLTSAKTQQPCPEGFLDPGALTEG